MAPLRQGWKRGWGPECFLALLLITASTAAEEASSRGTAERTEL